VKARTKPGPVVDAFLFDPESGKVPPFVKEMRRNVGCWGVVLKPTDPDLMRKILPGQYVIVPKDGSAKQIVAARQFHEQYDILDEEAKPKPKPKVKRGKAASVQRTGSDLAPGDSVPEAGE